jgi:hypothetical protein
MLFSAEWHNEMFMDRCLDSWYNDGYRYHEATKVESGSGASVSESLTRGRYISGVIDDGSTTVPGVTVTVYQPDGDADGWLDFEMSETTGATGLFTIGPVPPGDYLVSFDPSTAPGWEDYSAQWWPAASSEGAAQPLTMTLASNVPGISATLEPPPAWPTTSLDVAGGQVGQTLPWWLSAPTVQLTPSRPATTYYKWDAETQIHEYSVGLTPANGTHTLTYWSEDSLGNIEDPKQTREFNVDSTEPSPPGTLAVVQNGTGSALVTWTAAADLESGIQRYVLYRGDGTTINHTIPAGATSHQLTGLAVGDHSIKMKAINLPGLGSEFTSTVTFRVAGPAAPPVLSPVYRFFNAGNGTHFFTPSAEERDMVIAKWPSIFTYEGPAYYTNPANNTQPLYRFYNKKSASHFYTASADERDMIMRTWPAVFNYEGESYSVSPTASAGKLAVYRFYNKKNGSHFFTASAEERDAVIAKWSNVYSYEGPAFWLGQ